MLARNEILNNFGFGISTSAVAIKVKQFGETMVIDKKKGTVKYSTISKNELNQPIQLTRDKWAVIYGATYFEEACLIETEFYKTMGQLGVTV